VDQQDLRVILQLRFSLSKTKQKFHFWKITGMKRISIVQGHFFCLQCQKALMQNRF
jgi:hypothetical protein